MSDQYTCPMHPEVIEPKPDPCPKCDLALESVQVPTTGVLHPFIGLLLPPMIAATAMSLSSVSVFFNSLRLYRVEVS